MSTATSDMSLSAGPYARMNAYERTNTPNGPANPRTRPIDFGRSWSSRKHVAVADDRRRREERLELRAHGDRPAARPAAAVRLRERLVEVVVDDVEAHVARAARARRPRSGWRRRSRGARRASWKIAATSSIPSSKSPSVEGFVSISPAVRSSTFARRSSRSRLPRSVVATFASSKPAIVTLAGFVPCAVSAVMITFRPGSPRSANAARMIISPVSSPCEPAAGWSVTAGRPATSARIPCELPHQLERALDPVLLLQRMQVAEAGQRRRPAR